METGTMLLRKNEDKNNLIRSLNGQIRAKEGEDRVFVLSFSSEEPYERWFGTEILDHSESSVDLTRLNEIGCVLFNHERDKVVGKVLKAWIENNRGMAEIRFDEDEESDIIYKKVLNKTLLGVSVGYTVNLWEEVKANSTSGDSKYQGPCSIARSWEPYEISIVSVPADSTVGVGRDKEECKPKGTVKSRLDMCERQFLINLYS